MPLKHPGRLRALVLAIIAAASLLVSLPSIASAESPALPDAGRMGSLTLHKTRTPETAGQSGAPVASVTFSVQLVTGIDLSTSQGWADARALSAAFNPDDAAGSIADAGYGVQAAAGSPITTAASGIASISSLPLGLYLVTETSWPAGVTPSAPFVVAVPQTGTDGADWLYDLDVYPKNSVDAVTKSVDDTKALSIDEPVSWTITGDIPNVSTIDGYKITDTLDAKLSYVSAVVALADGAAISEGADFTTTYDHATRTVSVVFTSAGRAVLAAHHTSQVTVVVSTRVTATGEIANTAVLYPNQHSFDIAPGQPGGPTDTPPVLTKWGALTVLKTDENGDALAGAVFSVYATKTDAVAGENPLPIHGKTEFAVGADGRLTIAGLRYSDFAGGVELSESDPGYRRYWLSEVQAPQGYALLAEPMEFTITAKTTTAGVDLKITNFRSVEPPEPCAGTRDPKCDKPDGGLPPWLPKTGGPAFYLMIAGLALAVGGLLVVATNRRRRDA